jgi:hypothetical protein
MNDIRRLQGLTTEQFFYFFLRLRKGEVRRTVSTLQARYPDEGPEQLAKRLITVHSRLSLLGGSLLSAPLLLPRLGQGLKLAGVAGSASVMTRMHLYMILEIAAAFGKDIDDRARVPEMMAVVAATAAAAASPLLVDVLGINSLYAIPIAGLSATAVVQLVGVAAIRFYRSKSSSAAPASGSETAAVTA